MTPSPSWSFIALSFNNAGHCYIQVGLYEKSLNYHQQSLKIREKLVQLARNYCLDLV